MSFISDLINGGNRRANQVNRDLRTVRNAVRTGLVIKRGIEDLTGSRNYGYGGRHRNRLSEYRIQQKSNQYITSRNRVDAYLKKEATEFNTNYQQALRSGDRRQAEVWGRRLENLSTVIDNYERSESRLQNLFTKKFNRTRNFDNRFELQSWSARGIGRLELDLPSIVSGIKNGDFDNIQIERISRGELRRYRIDLDRDGRGEMPWDGWVGDLQRVPSSTRRDTTARNYDTRNSPWGDRRYKRDPETVFQDTRRRYRRYYNPSQTSISTNDDVVVATTTTTTPRVIPPLPESITTKSSRPISRGTISPAPVVRTKSITQSATQVEQQKQQRIKKLLGALPSGNVTSEDQAILSDWKKRIQSGQTFFNQYLEAYLDKSGGSISMEKIREVHKYAWRESKDEKYGETGSNYDFAALKEAFSGSVTLKVPNKLNIPSSAKGVDRSKFSELVKLLNQKVASGVGFDRANRVLELAHRSPQKLNSYIESLKSGGGVAKILQEEGEE